jgi:hypothetical protein
MSTTYGTGPEPNLRPLAQDDRLGRSQQTAYIGKQQGRIANVKRITQLSVEGNDH